MYLYDTAVQRATQLCVGQKVVRWGTEQAGRLHTCAAEQSCAAGCSFVAGPISFAVASCVLVHASCCLHAAWSGAATGADSKEGTIRILGKAPSMIQPSLQTQRLTHAKPSTHHISLVLCHPPVPSSCSLPHLYHATRFTPNGRQYDFHFPRDGVLDCEVFRRCLVPSVYVCEAVLGRGMLSRLANGQGTLGLALKNADGQHL